MNEEETKYLKSTISLLSSMVISGENHSESSLERKDKSLELLEKNEENDKMITMESLYHRLLDFMRWMNIEGGHLKLGEDAKDKVEAYLKQDE